VITAEIRAGDAAVDLPARDDRDLPAPHQAHAAAEEGDHVVVDARAELKDVDPLEKERAFLRKEQREARQVGLAGVDFGFGEVGVGGERRRHIRAETLGHVEARMELPVERCGRRGHAAAGSETGAQAQPAAESEFRQL
jgi:hypothetical protein